jgi:hypothetical protein
VTQNTWRGSLLKHSRSLHLETLYRLYFFRYIYNKCREKDSKREREKAQFSQRKKWKERKRFKCLVCTWYENPLSLSLSHTISRCSGGNTR